MNFASLPFLLGFLPLTLLLFHAIRGTQAGRWRVAFLTLASAIFYASSGWNNAVVLALSITANFAAGKAMLACAKDHTARRKAIMWLAVGFNLALLLGFKLTILAGDMPDGFTAVEDVILPLALSFVTFQQIGFIVGVQRGTIRDVSLGEYLFFVLFFPQLIMGPIIRYEDVRDQLRRGALQQVDGRWVAAGMAVFALALCKKVLLANPLGALSTPVFDATLAGPVAPGDAWYAVITFQMQLFFDFSAYAEMSIGLAMMMGMTMPLNFDRPLFARDRAEYWRRWHISFATFMRSTVFLPLVRRWKWPAGAALALTGILSGLWHGLGATFVVWGLAQTAILLFLHYRSTKMRESGRRRMPAPLAIAMTFLVTCLLGAMFRSPEIAAALHIYASLLGSGAMESAASQLTPMHVALTMIAAALVWLGPDMGQLFRGQWHYTELRAQAANPPVHWSERLLAFRATPLWGALTALALAVALFALVREGEAARFIYVQF